MIKIGDFSKLSRVSIKTLRYYDEMGLLAPIEVDPLTGYRYYAYHQLPRLYRVLALKDLGFSLEEIGRLLESDLSAEQLRGMLVLRQEEIRERVRDERNRLARVEIWLRQIEQEETVSNYDVVFKKCEAMRVASVRGTVPTPPEQGGLWNELEGYLAMQHIRPCGPCFTLYHDDDHREQDWDLEVCEPIDGDLAPGRKVRVYTLPAGNMLACTVHHGPFVTIGEAYNAIGMWLDSNGYRITGPCREIYLHSPAEAGNQNDPETVTEIQFPAEKA